VSGYILDTNAALIALTDPDKLTASIRKAVLEGPNVLSVASYWEVVLKSMKGNLDVGDPRTWWLDTLDQLGATPLAIRAEHVSEVHKLPPVHKDPFDRILVAQAIVEHLEIITTAVEVRRYSSARFRVVS
jgi:PIN domain nuclease of toxin-antitoxin system